MKISLKYEDRDNLYAFLIRDFGFKKMEEHYFPDHFNNFSVLLQGPHFWMHYVYDRFHLIIYIKNDGSFTNSDDYISLDELRKLVHCPDKMRTEVELETLNDFLIKDYDKICELVHWSEYAHTQKEISRLYKEDYFLK